MKYTGTLQTWFETGLEGLEWVLDIDEEFKGKSDKNLVYDDFTLIDDGDHLTIYGENGETVFAGEIVKDRKEGWRPYPGNPEFGQPTALGYWIHWTQQGWKADDWARLFFSKTPLRAELTKREKIV